MVKCNQVQMMILTLQPPKNIFGCFYSESGSFSILSCSMQPKRQEAQLSLFTDMSCFRTKSHQIGSLSLTEIKCVPALGLATAPVTSCEGMGKYQTQSSSPASEGLQNWWRRGGVPGQIQMRCCCGPEALATFSTLAGSRGTCWAWARERVKMRDNWQERTQSLKREIFGRSLALIC